MRKAEVKKRYNSITNIREEYMEEINAVGQSQRAELSGAVEQPPVVERLRNKQKLSSWLKWCIPAVCLCVVAGMGMWMLQKGNILNGGNGNANGSFWGGEDCTLLEVHREDFTPGLSAEEKVAFAGAPGVMKIYRTLNNSWFLAEDMTDFSQILTTDPFYIVHGATDYRDIGTGSHADESAYGVYTLDENGAPKWGGSSSLADSPANYTVPYGLCGLTYDIIEEDLAGIDYEDYIITQSTRLYTVIIWARCTNGEDMFVTYPARPEFVGLENRGLYTLGELQQALREAYYNN